MNCARVVNCACENKDRAGVNANCVGVDLDEFALVWTMIACLCGC